MWCDPYCFWCRYIHDTAPPGIDSPLYVATQRVNDVTVADRIPVCDRHAFWALLDTGAEHVRSEGSGYLIGGPKEGA